MPVDVLAVPRTFPRPNLVGACFGAALLVAGCTGSADDGATPPAPAWGFTDVTASAGLSGFRHETGATGAFWIPESIGSGGAFTDFDGDGWLDVVLVRGGYLTDERTIPALAAYRSQGDGTFRDVTETAGLANLIAYGQGLFAADVDNDGDDDLFLTTLGRNILLRNDGGRFTDVSAASGLAETDEWSTAAAFLDADRDGDLDLYVGNYVAWTPETDVFCSLDGVKKTYCTPKAYRGTPGRYFRNEGNLRFTDRTEEDGFGGTPGNSLGAVSFDFDRDGWTDVYVTNDLRPNLLFRNNGDGTFREIALESGAAYDERGYARAGMGVDAGVVDSTGRMTIFVGNFSREPIGVFQHTGDNVFLNREAATRLLRPTLTTLTFALFLFDADLDGNADILAVNGHVQPDIAASQRDLSYRQPVHLFQNQGDGTFRDVARELGPPLTEPLAGRGGAYGDFDRDGDLDLLITENGGSARLWRNDLHAEKDARAPHWLRVDLRGSRSNRDAIGARVRVHAGRLTIETQRRGGASYLSTSEKTLTFGLGDVPRADSVVVHWPSGQKSVVGPLDTDQVVTLTEE